MCRGPQASPVRHGTPLERTMTSDGGRTVRPLQARLMSRPIRAFEQRPILNTPYRIHAERWRTDHPQGIRPSGGAVAGALGNSRPR